MSYLNQKIILLSVKFDKNLAAIHGYLCSDGYVIKNPETQKHKYYYIGLRNFEETLLKDFQQKFTQVFGIIPIITNDGRCKIQNKEIYTFLTKDYSYYSYEWKLPKLNKENLRYWLRAFFDSEGWVENQPGKSRLIGADCCNESGLASIKIELSRLNIASTIHKRAGRILWRLNICGLDNLKMFQKQINFIHPQKSQKLNEAINSYKDYTWKIPRSKKELLRFIHQKGKIRLNRCQLQIFSIKLHNLSRLKKALNNYNITCKVFGPWRNKSGSKYYCLTMKTEV